MRVAIAGAGMSGAYLRRLLLEKGIEASLHDVPKTNRCRRRPCAWGFSPDAEYARLVSRFLRPDDYVLMRTDALLIDGAEAGADAVMVDKPALLAGLIGDAEVSEEPIDPLKFDRVVDATGVERAYLGPVDGRDLVAECRQVRMRDLDDGPPSFKLTAAGYEWSFPLGGGERHVGFGSLAPGAEEWDAGPGARMCGCRSRIRVSSPRGSLPFVRGNVVGVGEAIGTVGPLAGDGNVYAMQSAEILMRNWGDLEAYEDEITRTFSWMARERLALERVAAGKAPGLTGVRAFRAHAKRCGLKLSLRESMALLSRMKGSGD